MKKTQLIIAILLGLLALGGAATKFESRYARAEVLEAVSERLDNKILRDRRDDLEERLWKLENRHAERFWEDKGRAHADIEELVAWMSKAEREQWRRLERDLAEAEKELDRRAKKEKEE